MVGGQRAGQERRGLCISHLNACSMCTDGDGPLLQSTRHKDVSCLSKTQVKTFYGQFVVYIVPCVCVYSGEMCVNISV